MVETASERITGEVASWPGVEAGPGVRAIADDADVADVIALLRLNYERVVARHGLPVRSAYDAADDRARAA